MLRTTTLSILSGLALLASASSTHATLIAADSFWTSTAGGDYAQSRFVNQTATAGTTGFTGTTWASGTATISVDASGLSHSALAGTAQPGSAKFFLSHPRNASRDVSATIPVSPSYYLGGVVRANAANPFTVDLDYFALGFLDENAGFGTDTQNINSGMHIGMRRNDTLGGLRLTAFGAGQFFDLGPANADTDYLIALELQADPAGLETLNAWTAPDGAALTRALTGQTLETFSGVGDLGQFVVQASLGNQNQVTRGFGDEIRLGTSFADVAVIPEPSSLSLFGLALLLLYRARAFRH